MGYDMSMSQQTDRHILKDRIRRLNDKPTPDEDSCVLYIMSRDMRLHDNFALQVAQEQALRLEVPLAVAFVLYPRSGRRAREHYRFMLDGLKEVESGLAAKGVPFMLMLGKGEERIKGLLHHLKPQSVVFDFSPLRGPLKLHRAIASLADCPVVEVDTHNVVPVWKASDHQEIAARTLRPKINRLVPDYLEEARPLSEHPHAWPGTVKTIADLSDMIEEQLAGVPENGSDTSRFRPGEKAARQAMKDFLQHRLKGYASQRNDPSQDGQSELNPYFHYGQLSVATVVREIEQLDGRSGPSAEDADAFIEEAVVRKELSDNFCLYNDGYDKLSGAPEWARNTLEKHKSDARDFTYSRAQFEAAETHDEAWNAAQRQLVRSGKIHGYMRMYWAKKVLEWSNTPQGALETLLYLNDFYHIDGGDPNGYVGILWSIAGLHDRPWQERPVYGTVRSMVYNGLKRKFDIEAYIREWS